VAAAIVSFKRPGAGGGTGDSEAEFPGRASVGLLPRLKCGQFAKIEQMQASRPSQAASRRTAVAEYQAAQQNLADVLLAVAAGRKRLALAKKSLKDLDANQDASRLVRGAAKAGGATGEGWLASAKPK